MTEKKPYLAKLTGRGLDGTGVTDAVARQLVLAKGRRYMAVVEVEVHTIHDKPEQMIADLSVEQFWPVVDDDKLDEHLRGLSAGLHSRRGSDDGDEQLDLDGPTPKVADIIAAGQQFRPHPFLPVDAADDNGICDICGHVDGTGPHATAPTADEPDDGDEVPDEVDDDEAETPSDWCPFPDCSLRDEHDGRHQDSAGKVLPA
jgi:hypothetical protein